MGLANIALVFIGGGSGSLLRFLIGIWMQRVVTALPLATFLSNVSSCFIFVMVVNAWGKEGLTDGYRLLLLTGFCGGLSTFSTFSYETWFLLQQQMYMAAILNIVLSTVLCVLMFYLIK